MTRHPAARVVFVVLVIAVAAFLVATFFSRGGPPSPEDRVGTETPPTTFAEQQQEEQCAVCGKTLPADQMQVIPPDEPGQPPVYVCSDECRQEYESNPERYKSMAQREKGEALPPPTSATGPSDSGG